MKRISLKIKEQIFQETEHLLEHLQTSRNKYINEAIKFYNEYQRRKRIEEQLIQELALVAEDSMSVLQEVESLAGGV